MKCAKISIKMNVQNPDPNSPKSAKTVTRPDHPKCKCFTTVASCMTGCATGTMLDALQACIIIAISSHFVIFEPNTMYLQSACIVPFQFAIKSAPHGSDSWCNNKHETNNLEWNNIVQIRPSDQWHHFDQVWSSVRGVHAMSNMKSRSMPYACYDALRRTRAPSWAKLWCWPDVSWMKATNLMQSWRKSRVV